jgi:integrase
MARRLTALSVESTRPRGTRFEVPDGGCRGLYLVVQPSGRKSWAVRYRFDRTPKKLTLTGALTLAAARKAASEALHELTLGRDPAALKSAAKSAADRAAADLAADTVEKLAADYLAKYARVRTRRNSWRQAEHILNDIVVAAWRGRTVHEIRRRDVIDLIEDVASGRPILANRTLAALSKFFNWLASRDVIVASPCAGVARPSREHQRDRILTDGEIKSLWEACTTVGGVAGACIKMLLLTGQRRSEVAGMRRSEINGDVWTLPPTRTKNNRRHDVPLSRQALALIDSLPVLGDPVFTIDGEKPLTSFSRIKNALDLIAKPAAPYVLHDLRRTVASGMARLGILLPVIERVLNHASGSFRGIVGVYQRHDFAAEKRAALQRWADHVQHVVKGEATETVVVQFRTPA